MCIRDSSKAARNLHISQSAISRTIKALEDELGVVLFMRNAKSVELTDGGTIFLTHAKRVVFMFEHLKTDFENEFRLEQGSIRIGIPPITDAPIFAQLLGEFKKVYPDVYKRQIHNTSDDIYKIPKHIIP